MTRIELGLVGSGIEGSLAPLLHETLGRLTGRPVRYSLYDFSPTQLDEVDALLLDDLPRRGVTGVNITHPFKEHVARLVTAADPDVAAIEAVNTVRFGTGAHHGENTDYTGFVHAYRRRFAPTEPGVVAQIGAGGVGRATAFALATLGADAIRLYDLDRQRADRLAHDLAATGVAATVCGSAEEAAEPADGILNCSPVGSHLHPGCPIDPAALAGRRWVFDAVYTPTPTEFLTAARRHGADCMPGTELFLWQGVDAFRIFHRAALDDATVRAAADLVEAEIGRRNDLDD